MPDVKQKTADHRQDWFFCQKSESLDGSVELKLEWGLTNPTLRSGQFIKERSLDFVIIWREKKLYK